MKAILFAAVSQHMEEVARNVLTEMGLDIEIDTASSVAELVDRHPEARVFISRGGRAQRIRQATGKPVVSIIVSFYDLLPPLHRLISSGAKKIAIVTNINFIDPTAQDFQIGQTQVRVRPWSSPENLQQILQELSDEGGDGIGGDRDGTEAARILKI